ncbi:MAG TPA: glutamate-1-semialdehyde 2,1-aminomutase [Trueperaceae bacterium]
MESRVSRELFARAKALIPGGVNSPVRAFGAVGGTPPFIDRALGSRLWDADGNEYIDLVGSWGPMILGHNHPAVVEALEAALKDGVSFGAPTRREVELAELVLSLYPACERIRFVNSGTEATMSALRLARGATGRDGIIKFAGNYHGHADSLLVAAGSGALTTGVPSSAGVPAATVRHTLVARYNDLDSVRELFEAHPDGIAAVILEPVAGNMGVVAPTPQFIAGLRELTREHGALLVVDEVMTGFRLAPGGAVERFGLEPDLVCWGKIIGGGLPVGAYGGPAQLMEQVSPSGAVYQAGTLSGNPLAMAAGKATLETIRATPDLYQVLESRGERLERELAESAAEAGVEGRVNRVGSMLTLFFTSEPVADFESATSSDLESFKRFFHGLLERGVYWPASQFEAAFLSYAHSGEEIGRVTEAARSALARLSA